MANLSLDEMSQNIRELKTRVAELEAFMQECENAPYYNGPSSPFCAEKESNEDGDDY